jgi:hypothetical protein
MMKHTTTLLLIAVLATPAFAQETRSPEEWVARIKAEAAAEKPSQELQTLRLAAGVYITHGTAQPKDTMDSWSQKYPESAKALLSFMEGDGKRILAKLRAGQALTAEEEPLRRIVLGCWLKAGYDLSSKKKAHSLYLHNLLLPDEAAGQEAVEFHEEVTERGTKALVKGYIQRELSAADVDRIRLYRIAQGMRGVGEAFLPMTLGIHEFKAHGHAGAVSGHRDDDIYLGRLGKPLVPMRLATLEAVRAREAYDDKPRTEYGFRYPFMPEGVLEYLEPITGYMPGQAVGGNPAVTIKPEFQTRPAEGGGEILLSDLTGGKPLLLMINDAVDCALIRHIYGTPTILKAWRDHLDWAYIQVNIHDWYYASVDWRDYLGGPGLRPQHHAWSEEERARRISQRLVQNPQNDDMRILVDTQHHHVKDLYAAGGGATHYWVFDAAGNAVFKYSHTRCLTPTINMLEYALSCFVEGGCRDHLELPYDTTRERRTRADFHAVLKGRGPTIVPSAPHTIWPQDPVLLIQHSTILDVMDDRFTIKVRLGNGEHVITCRPTRRAHVEVRTGKGTLSSRALRDAAEGPRPAASLADLKPGMRVVAKCRFSAMGFKGNVVHTPYVYNWSKTPKARQTVVFPGMTAQVEQVCDDYGSDYICLTPVELDRGGEVPVFWVRAAEGEKWPEGNWQNLDYVEASPSRETLWRGGIVTRTDDATRTIEINPWPYDRERLDGRHILEQWQNEGRTVHLDDVTRARHAAVARWLASEGKPEVYVCDDDVAYTLNGLYVAGFHDIRVGDRVTVRYRVQHDASETIPASMVRVSRVGTKTNTKQNKTE